MHEPVLVLHIAAAVTALVAGPVAMRAPKRRGLHTNAGGVYHWLVLATCVSGATLAALDLERIWWLIPVAAFSYTFALVGYVAARVRWRGWLVAHISGQGGSYIALLTALLVVNAGTDAPLAWILPTAVGSPIVAWANARAARRMGVARRVERRLERPRPPEGVALGVVDPVLAEQREGGVVGPLGHGGHSELPGDVDDRADQDLVAPARGNMGDELSVDLQEVERHVLEVVEAAERRAEVVERDAAPERAHPRAEDPRALDVGDGGGLGDLEDEPRGVGAESLEDRLHEAGEPRVVDGPPRQIHVQRDSG